MSYANLLNYKGELIVPAVNTAKVNTGEVKLYDTTEDTVLTSAVVKHLMLRIQALEAYIQAHQETYSIQTADGDTVRWTYPTPPG